MTIEERLDRIEQAIRELHSVLEEVADRNWPLDSKVLEIVNE